MNNYRPNKYGNPNFPHDRTPVVIPARERTIRNMVLVCIALTVLFVLNAHLFV